MFKSELQIDARGYSKLIGPLLTIFIGEFKSGGGFQEGREQLITALAVLREGSQVLLMADKINNVIFSLSGSLFTRTLAWKTEPYNTSDDALKLQLKNIYGFNIDLRFTE